MGVGAVLEAEGDADVVVAGFEFQHFNGDAVFHLLVGGNDRGAIGALGRLAAIEHALADAAQQVLAGGNEG
ncbi:hypothetical protein D3C76_1693170 [compost metagenome]